MWKSQVKKPFGLNKVLEPNDTVRLYFKTIGGVWIKAFQIALIESSLSNHELFSIIRADYWQQDGAIFTVRVKKTNPVVVTVALIAAAIALVPIAFGWSFVKAEKLLESSSAQIFTISIAALIGTIAVMIILKK
ncbi:unnamed protein product [marine sediment metagenome]|uniref:Uncharacterized protein n=1 Tax=marine sediment metagenome TaxID=412755 RepID=X1EUA6_9ZZZZ